VTELVKIDALVDAFEASTDVRQLLRDVVPVLDPTTRKVWFTRWLAQGSPLRQEWCASVVSKTMRLWTSDFVQRVFSLPYPGPKLVILGQLPANSGAVPLLQRALTDANSDVSSRAKMLLRKIPIAEQAPRRSRGTIPRNTSTRKRGPNDDDLSPGWWTGGQ
jgi:hypothetical protein